MSDFMMEPALLDMRRTRCGVICGVDYQRHCVHLVRQTHWVDRGQSADTCRTQTKPFMLLTTEREKNLQDVQDGVLMTTPVETCTLTDHLQHTSLTREHVHERSFENAETQNTATPDQRLSYHLLYMASNRSHVTWLDLRRGEHRTLQQETDIDV